MNINATLLNVFKINPHEKNRVLLLILYLFFLGIYVSYFFSFANGAFLSKFDIKYLPLAYVLSGILGFLFSTIFTMIQKRVKFYDLLVGAMIFILLLTLLFVAGFRMLEDTKWLTFVVFVSVGPIFSLINISYWGLTTSLFDLREGKRLFGVIGSGDVISSILSYFSIPFVVKIVGDLSNLMVIGILGLVISIVFQLIIMRRLPEAKVAQNISKKKSKGPGLSLKAIFINKYFRFVFLLVMISMLVQYFVDYNFMGIAREQMKDDIALTKFIGIFFGLVKLVELLFRTLAAGRLMSKFGMILGLLLLPVLVLSFTIIALGSFYITGNLLLFFLLLAMIKLVDKVVRRSLEEPAVKTLYQPVDPKTKMLLQTSIEGKGKQLAVMLAGGILMLFNLIPDFSIAVAALISCLLIIVWIFYGYKTYNEYRILLNKQLTAPLNVESQVNEWNNGSIFCRGIDSGNPMIFLKSTLAIYNMKPDVLIPLYPSLIRHTDQNVRILSIKWLKETPLFSLLEPLKDQSKLENNLDNRKNLTAIIDNIKRVYEASEEEVKALFVSGAKEDKIMVAAWICHFEKYDLVHILDDLLKDKDPRVVRATSFYISSVQNPVFLKVLLACFLENKTYEHSVIKTILLHSDKAPSLLNNCFNEFGTDEKFVLIEEAFRSSLTEPLMLINIFNTLGRLGHEDSIAYLKQKLNGGNWAIQYFILENLKRLEFSAEQADLATFRQLILKETSFCAWILASKFDLNKGEYFPELITSLDEQLASSKVKIFNILSFLYPREAIANIENNIMSGIQEKEVMALEMADILLDEVHKDIIFPLFDKISIAEKVKNLSQHFPQAIMSQEERLKNIIFYDYAILDNVTKAFAVRALKSNLKTIPYEIIAQIYSNDLLLKEIGYLELYNKDASLFDEYINRESEKTKLQLIKTLTDRDKTMFSRLSIVDLLNDQPLFKYLPFWKLSLIASFFEPCIIKANDTIKKDGSVTNSVYIFVQGEIRSKSITDTNNLMKSGELFGFYSPSIFEQELDVIQDSLFLTVAKSDFHRILNALPEISEFLYNIYISDEFKIEAENEEREGAFLEYSKEIL